MTNNEQAGLRKSFIHALISTCVAGAALWALIIISVQRVLG
jgi:hypothetical protein